MKTLVIALLISMLPSFLTMSYAGDSGGEDSPVLPTGTNSLALDEQWRQFTQLVDNKDYGKLEAQDLRTSRKESWIMQTWPLQYFKWVISLAKTWIYNAKYVSFIVDNDDYEELEAFLNNLENKELFLKSQYTDEDEGVTYTPLHYASVKSVPKVVQLLISQGADVYATVTDKATPLHYAAMAANLATITLLLSRNDSLESKPDDQGFTPLHIAILEEVQDIIACFSDHMLKEPKSRKEENTVALKAQDSFGNTPVHYAFSSGNKATAPKIVEVLTILDPRDIACIMQTKNKEGDTPQEIIKNQPGFSALQEKINQKILKG